MEPWDTPVGALCFSPAAEGPLEEAIIKAPTRLPGQASAHGGEAEDGEKLADNRKDQNTNTRTQPFIHVRRLGPGLGDTRKGKSSCHKLSIAAFQAETEGALLKPVQSRIFLYVICN